MRACVGAQPQPADADVLAPPLHIHAALAHWPDQISLHLTAANLDYGLVPG